jgi:hypothetical protein
MSGLLAPTARETTLGNAQILQIFSISKVGKVAGCRVTDGVVQRGANVRLIRDNVVIHEGKLAQLKHLKEDVREVTAGHECGMSFESYQDMRVGDVIECYRVELVQRTLYAQGDPTSPRWGEVDRAKRGRVRGPPANQKPPHPARISFHSLSANLSPVWGEVN